MSIRLYVLRALLVSLNLLTVGVSYPTCASLEAYRYVRYMKIFLRLGSNTILFLKVDYIPLNFSQI